MLIACRSCHRQYDTSSLPIGAKIRCLCSEQLEVVEVTPRDMQMLRCASCGGQLTEDATECRFCGSSAALGERGFGGTCPECFARMPKDARFCCTCGVAIQPVASLTPLHDKPCPRCEEATLAIQEFPGGSITECTRCGGIWLDASVFEAIAQAREEHTVSKFVTRRGGPAEIPERELQVRYLKCPSCTQFMQRKNFASVSGVIIDRCLAHGIWFDRNELEHILGFIADGGLEQARDKAHLRQKLELQQKEREIERKREAMQREVPLGGGIHDPFGGGDWIGGLFRAFF